MKLKFDRERDCSQSDVVQDFRVVRGKDCITIEQYDGGGDEIYHCVAIPLLMVPVLQMMLGSALVAEEYRGVFDTQKVELDVEFN